MGCPRTGLSGSVKENSEGLPPVASEGGLQRQEVSLGCSNGSGSSPRTLRLCSSLIWAWGTHRHLWLHSSPMAA